MKNLKWLLFASSIMKNIVVFPVRSRFPVKLIFSIVLGSGCSACYLLESIAIKLKCYLKKGCSTGQPVV